MAYNPRDAFYRRARREGYRSRAAYKLLELNRRYHLLRPADRVVDLGAAPGGWLQVASQLVGPKGKVVGVDLNVIDTPKEKNITTVQGDIASEETQKKIAEILQSDADCALSDLSPPLSGIRDADMSRSIELNRTALKVATRLLKPGGNFLMKSFVGEELNELAGEIQKWFRSVQRTRPEATRKGSSEIYFCAKGFQKGP